MRSPRLFTSPEPPQLHHRPGAVFRVDVSTSSAARRALRACAVRRARLREPAGTPACRAATPQSHRRPLRHQHRRNGTAGAAARCRGRLSPPGDTHRYRERVEAVAGLQHIRARAGRPACPGASLRTHGSAWSRSGPGGDTGVVEGAPPDSRCRQADRRHPPRLVEAVGRRQHRSRTPVPAPAVCVAVGCGPRRERYPR